jgi:hypothetical protein
VQQTHVRSHQIGGLTIRNPFIVSPMVVNYCTTDGYAARRTSLSRGQGRGWVLSLLRTTPSTCAKLVGIAGLWEDAQIQGHTELTNRVHKHGAAIFAQITRRAAATRSVSGMGSVASAICCPHGQMPHALSPSESNRSSRSSAAARCVPRGPASTSGVGGRLPDRPVHVLVLEQRFDRYGSLYNRAFPLRLSPTFGRDAARTFQSNSASPQTNTCPAEGLSRIRRLSCGCLNKRG